MRKWTPVVAVAALASAGILWTGSPKPAEAQNVVAAVPATLVDTAFLSGGVDFEATKGSEAVKPVTVSFPGRLVQSADVMLKGFDAQFVDAEHPLHQTRIKLENVQVSGETVKFDARLAIRDNSGELDDKYSGHIDYVVIARVR